MSETICCLKVGQKVSDFTIKTFDPVKMNFGNFSLARQKKNKKWTVLFFYPADFTFV